MENLKKVIDTISKCDKINDKEIANSFYEMTVKLKEHEVISICGSLPKKPNYKGGRLYRKIITVQGVKKEISSETYLGLVEKLYNYLTDSSLFSFEAIFQKALEHKKSIQIRSSNTFYSYESTYKRFIKPSLATLDIRSITKTDLQIYTKELVCSQHMKEKAFLKYKGILNLAFEYAIDQGLILTNPAKRIRKSDYLLALDTTKAKSENKIFTHEELNAIQSAVRKRMTYKIYNGFDSIGYGILLSMLTGMRVGEICALKWVDVSFDKEEIHIHEQQLREYSPKGQNNFYHDVGWTKDEKGISNGGRIFPVYQELKELLFEIRDKEKQLDIESEYVICKHDGTSIKTDAYITSLQRLCISLGLSITNNHAFRMTFNSLVLIPAGFTVTERARMLGHSVETNLKHYSFDPRNSEKEKVDRINAFLQVPPSPTENVVLFEQKKKA